MISRACYTHLFEPLEVIGIRHSLLSVEGGKVVHDIALVHVDCHQSFDLGDYHPEKVRQATKQGEHSTREGISGSNSVPFRYAFFPPSKKNRSLSRFPYISCLIRRGYSFSTSRQRRNHDRHRGYDTMIPHLELCEFVLLSCRD